MKLHVYYTYILCNKYNTVLYTGVTNNLVRRCHEHKNKLVKGFTEKYNVDKLVYFEVFDFIDQAIAREKQIKAYSKAKKEALIAGFNPDWKALYNNGKIETPKG
jgi:putative endonuclease